MPSSIENMLSPCCTRVHFEGEMCEMMEWYDENVHDTTRNDSAVLTYLSSSYQSNSVTPSRSRLFTGSKGGWDEAHICKLRVCSVWSPSRLPPSGPLYTNENRGGRERSWTSAISGILWLEGIWGWSRGKNIDCKSLVNILQYEIYHNTIGIFYIVIFFYIVEMRIYTYIYIYIYICMYVYIYIYIYI